MSVCPDLEGGPIPANAGEMDDRPGGGRYWVEAAWGEVIQGVNCQLPIRDSGFHAEG